MKRPACAFFALLLPLATASAQSSEFRTFTNSSGKTIRAKLVSAAAGQAVIVMENGQQFNLPLHTLSAADQEYIKAQAAAAPATAAAPAPKPASSSFKFAAGPNDKLEPEAVNEAVGQSLFAAAPLWDTSAEEVAQKLGLRPESKTKAASSFRSYTKDDYNLFGAHPYSVAMYAENDKITNLSLVFANKGDLFSSKGSGEMHFDKNTPPAQAALIVKKAMDKDLAAITQTLTKKLGEPKKERFGEGKVGRMNMQRWDWRGHSILLAEAEGEYVGLQIVTSAFADAGGKVARTSDTIVRAMALANLDKRSNGDIVVGDIPMVDQGPKGYCVPATAERAMRYLGVPADMYILANAGETGFGGGTSVNQLLEGVGRHIRNKGRSFDTWQGELKMRDIARQIDKGVPIMWTLYSTDDFNKTANNRTKERANVTDWAAWKTKVTGEAAASALRKDRTSGHVVLIIGYNKDTNEIAFSDSWGERYKERWITMQEAELVSQGFFYVVGF